MADLIALTAANAQRWQRMNVHTSLVNQIDAIAKRLISPDAKARFKEVSAITGVPWAIIAVIKEREAGVDSAWARNIAQGDPWNRVSTHVPAGRGPFNSWKDAAYDALVNCAPRAGRWKDWSPGGALTILEMYNGLGYASRGLPSPYIWSSTDQYRSGKYVADGVFDPNVVDAQIGCAPLLARMIALDASADFTRKTASGSGPAIIVAAGGATAGAAHTAGLSTSLTIALIIGAVLVVGAIIYKLRN